MNKIKILVGGVFDIIHLGHIKFLWAAKRLAKNSELIVVIARDSTVMRLKGREPVFSELERAEIVRNLKPVDKVILGHEISGQGSFYEILKEVKPDIVVFGYDQKFDEEELAKWAKENNMSFRIIRLPKFNINGLNSSSQVRRRVIKLLGHEEK